MDEPRRVSMGRWNSRSSTKADAQGEFLCRWFVPKLFLRHRAPIGYHRPKQTKSNGQERIPTPNQDKKKRPTESGALVFWFDGHSNVCTPIAHYNWHVPRKWILRRKMRIGVQDTPNLPSFHRTPTRHDDVQKKEDGRNFQEAVAVKELSSHDFLIFHGPFSTATLELSAPSVNDSVGDNNKKKTHPISGA